MKHEGVCGVKAYVSGVGYVRVPDLLLWHVIVNMDGVSGCHGEWILMY